MMVPEDFHSFLNHYLKSWRSFSIEEIKKCISNEYQAREADGHSEIIDFGYQESVEGWEQAFSQLRDHAEWIINEIGILPLKNNEVMVILSATLLMDEQPLDKASLFFQTFKKDENECWKLIMSYIEAGVPKDHLNSLVMVDKES
ncbi:hypothetical protein GCM10010954_10530 [Halobacillus andaensis]|uniref:Flavoprotein n=1 Tax=Halobacillus andaensis TaxID=1176239 RepID=A0A917B0D6_HALAA|nr:flavoprotein [Halobacillus andaensis]MBP2003844.1 hypothetical protein [Halobacillus andaensis]GGF13685.1 hypothetical protein GCM10010954_10530 [Halobacillus andaensis]